MRARKGGGGEDDSDGEESEDSDNGGEPMFATALEWNLAESSRTRWIWP